MPDRLDQFARREVLELLERLHLHKDAAYGDAWRKRGEVIAIFANMARKYDRLVVAFDEQRAAATEPLGDTVADLCVYAVKYLTWIADEHPADFDDADLPIAAASASARRGPAAAQVIFDALAQARPDGDPPEQSDVSWRDAQSCFTVLERALMAQTEPHALAATLLGYAEKARLAWRLADHLTSLLLGLEREDPSVLGKLRAEVAAMDRLAAT